MFRKKKKEKRKYQTNLTLYGIIKIKAPEPSHIIINAGVDPEYTIISVSTGFSLYSIKIKEEKLLNPCGIEPT